MLKSPKMIITQVTYVEFAPTHSEKPGPSPKYVFHLSSQNVCVSAHDI
jgi:hypothetical protein